MSSVNPVDTLEGAVAQPRYHILALEDGGDFLHKPCFLSGGAGMLTTAHDYLRFSQVHIYILIGMFLCA